MAFIKSISGFRGTIGGKPGDNLTPVDLVECAAAFAQWAFSKTGNKKVVIGRDGRISGEIVSQLVTATLRSMGMDVLDLGYSTTPTVEMAVPNENAGAGIILTASHNPKEWNALKLLNQKGEFISGADGKEVLALADAKDFNFASVEELGSYEAREDGYMPYHIEKVLGLDMVDVEAIKAKNYKIVVDGINSTGSLAVPMLLEELNCEVILLNGEINGRFAHNPEPLKDNLLQTCREVINQRANMGIVVDPDVDRLVFISEDGELFGEEYTLVAIADYVLTKRNGAAVSNLSSSRALSDICSKHGQPYFAAAVGEVNVVEKMKAVGAVIGGEGNGGIILPELHYGRDALVGIALFLTYVSNLGKNLSMVRRSYPDYKMVKGKIPRSPDMDFEIIKEALAEKYKKEKINTIDGLKIDFEEGWVHLRPSNTEPIIRVYSESSSEVIAQSFVRKIMEDIGDLAN